MPFDNLSGIKTKKYNLGLFILLTFLALVGTMIIPVLGLLGAALLPIPTSLLIIGGRVRSGVICTVISCLVIFFFSYILSPVMMFVIITTAFVHRDAIEKKLPAWKTISTVFLVFAGAVLLYLLLYVIFFGVGSIKEISSNYNSYIDGMADDPIFLVYTELLMIEVPELDAVISQTQALLRFLPKIIPGILAVSFALISTTNYLISSNVYKRNQIEIRSVRSFMTWDFPWYYVWGIIVGLVLILIPEMGSSVDGSSAFIDTTIDVLGFNLVIIFGALYTVLGISVLWGIFIRFKLALVVRIIITAFLLFFFGIALIVVPLIGLIDIWVNFRKLKRD